MQNESQQHKVKSCSFIQKQNNCFQVKLIKVKLTNLRFYNFTCASYFTSLLNQLDQWGVVVQMLPINKLHDDQISKFHQQYHIVYRFQYYLDNQTKNAQEIRQQLIQHKDQYYSKNNQTRSFSFPKMTKCFTQNKQFLSEIIKGIQKDFDQKDIEINDQIQFKEKIEQEELQKKYYDSIMEINGYLDRCLKLYNLQWDLNQNGEVFFKKSQQILKKYKFYS